MSVLEKLGVLVVGTVLFVLSWLLLGVLALGDAVVSPIPRTPKTDDYL